MQKHAIRAIYVSILSVCSYLATAMQPGWRGTGRSSSREGAPAMRNTCRGSKQSHSQPHRFAESCKKFRFFFFFKSPKKTTTTTKMYLIFISSLTDCEREIYMDWNKASLLSRFSTAAARGQNSWWRRGASLETEEEEEEEERSARAATCRSSQQGLPPGPKEEQIHRLQAGCKRHRVVIIIIIIIIIMIIIIIC